MWFGTWYGDQDIEPLKDVHLLDAPSVDQGVDLTLTASVQQHQTALRPHQQVHSWQSRTQTQIKHPSEGAGQTWPVGILDALLPQRAAHRISELNLFLYLRISGVSLGGRVLTGLTLTTEPLREGSDLSGSASRPSCPNAAGGRGHKQSASSSQLRWWEASSSVGEKPLLSTPLKHKIQPSVTGELKWAQI